MGTNFYVRCHGHVSATGKPIHIGKRSAAGLYCYSCKVSLCKDGEKGVNHSISKWHDQCPKCSKKPIKESLAESSAGIELGFNKDVFKKKKKGVASCSAFNWSIKMQDLIEIVKKEFEEPEGFIHCPCCQQTILDRENVIQDEYGQLFTWKAFDKLLKACPIHKHDSIGQEFS